MPSLDVGYGSRMFGWLQKATRPRAINIPACLLCYALHTFNVSITRV
jgi:hypothetical protein